MQFAFYFSGGIAVLATLAVILQTRPVHALLYLIVSLLAMSMSFFSMGAPFAGVLEIVVYAGGIMVLFVFVVMMLNLGDDSQNQERGWLTPGIWIGPAILSGLLLAQLLYVLFSQTTPAPIVGTTVDAKAVGISLFTSYLLAVELASMLLLGALVTAFHLGRPEAKEQA